MLGQGLVCRSIRACRLPTRHGVREPEPSVETAAGFGVVVVVVLVGHRPRLIWSIMTFVSKNVALIITHCRLVRARRV